MKPRNHVVLALLKSKRKSGAHGKTKKAERRAEKVQLQIVEDTFDKVYSSSPVPEERAKKYETYSWNVYYNIDSNFILSDSACVVIKKNGDVSFFDDAPEEVKALILPISIAFIT